MTTHKLNVQSKAQPTQGTIAIQSETRRKTSRRPLQFWVGLIIILGILFVAIFANWLSPHDYAEQNLVKGMLPPFWMDGSDPAYLLGTDRLGRDLLSRLMFGARVSTAVGLFSVLLGGASLAGGQGTLVGTLLAVLLLGTLNNGIILLGINSHWQVAVNGFAILIAVFLDARRRRALGQD